MEQTYEALTISPVTETDIPVVIQVINSAQLPVPLFPLWR